MSNYCINRGLLDEDQRAQFGEIVNYFNENLTPLARDLAFLLGFYVKVSSIIDKQIILTIVLEIWPNHFTRYVLAQNSSNLSGSGRSVVGSV